VAVRHPAVESVLRQRVRYFLRSSWRGRREVASTIDRLSVHGEVLVFGGMLRDLMLRGNAGFDSDIDLVLVGAERDKTAKLLAALSARRNRFGGHRIVRRYWKLDVWHLEDTWAFKNGWIAPASPEQLVNTTFFTWDAAVLSLTTGTLWEHERFEEHVSQRILDVNLTTNPNSRGVTIRALRFVFTYEARMTRVLARYVLDVLEAVEPEALIHLERSSYTAPILSGALVRDMRRHLAEYEAHSAAPLVAPPLYQYGLGLQPLSRHSK
jgi:hypothetical protein